MTALSDHRSWTTSEAAASPGRALLLGDDIGIFLAVARSLGRRGIEVHVAQADEEAPGLASRYVAAVHRLPPYHRSPSDWLEALSALIAVHGFALVVPCSDSSLMILDRHGESLGRERLALPNREALAAFSDKTETRALARRLGVPVAQGTEAAPATDASALARQLGLPLVLKPHRSYRIGALRTKTAAVIVRDLAALRRALARTADGGWLAEAYFEGDGIGVSVIASGGRILLAWQHRRLECVSDTGASTVRVGEPLDARLLAHVEALAGATSLTGVAMFEFRQNRATGEHVLLEVNPRFWGSLPLAVAAGADFPVLLWDLAAGRAPAPGRVRREGVVRRSLTGEFDRLVARIEAPGAGAGRVAAAASMLLLVAGLVRPSLFDSWAADDPAPFRAERRQILTRLARGLAKRVHGQPALAGRSAP